jgi:anaerobic ribonucleoside-triphosphate reductase activating protein
VKLPNNLLWLADSRLCRDLEGPGLRIVFFFSGCSIRCPGCCNAELFEMESGCPVNCRNVLEKYNSAGAEGISALGGEPFDQPEALLELVRTAQTEFSLGVMVFSGYELAYLKDNFSPLLSYIDILKTGPFIREKACSNRRWIGSENQQFHFLSERYNYCRQDFEQANEFEICLKEDELIISGFPILEKWHEKS